MNSDRSQLGDYAASRLHLHVSGPDPDGSTTIVLSGELDGQEAEPLHDTVMTAALRCAPAPVRLDATRLTFLDSSGIRALLSCRSMAASAGSRLLMPRVHPHVFQVLDITGLLTIFGVTEPVGSRLTPHADTSGSTSGH
ncbi:STAS domain-containing protein [Actinoplanes sp. NPDC051861]|uniref:STAS domain-containing protein n=1 Tax=Actinoplanes sp. NPDC051861 TaxID=3155170 RepID=UPI00342EECD2